MCSPKLKKLDDHCENRKEKQVRKLRQQAGGGTPASKSCSLRAVGAGIRGFEREMQRTGLHFINQFWGQRRERLGRVRGHLWAVTQKNTERMGVAGHRAVAHKNFD